ncbi:MAG TPA: bifunctional nicotinamidase/pyrazinamidase [Stellaceae bacterium]|nr:bifunctional nicotinamidase/pyrazinamidase [Stellaceae bacterium]
MRERSEQDVLLIVDVQNDFCPGGALAVPAGDAIMPVVNRLAREFAHVVLTQDWHPPGHSSFASSHPGHAAFEMIEMPYGRQILWPDHCVQGTAGASFHPALEASRAELVLRKGYHQAIDSYSAFRENDRRTETGLAGYLKERGFTRVTLCGLAIDFCVLYSALDAVAAGFAATVMLDACRGIDREGSIARALDELRAAGVDLVSGLS